MPVGDQNQRERKEQREDVAPGQGGEQFRPSGRYRLTLRRRRCPPHGRSIRTPVGAFCGPPTMDVRMTGRGQRDSGQNPRSHSSPDPRRAFEGDVKRGTSTSGLAHERLIETATHGDPAAKESLIREQLGWIEQAAGQRAGRGLSEGDLVQEGCLGLIKAIDEFAESGRTDFDAFAREQVSEHMEQAIAQEGRAQEESRRLLEAAEELQRVDFALRRELGREPTPAELAAKLEWPQERTESIAEMVGDARRRHDEELLEYLDPEELDLDQLLGDSEGAAGTPRTRKDTNGGPSAGQGRTPAEQ